MNESTSSEDHGSDVQRQLQTQDGSFQNEDALFQSLSSYPFDSDPEYINGLSTILGHPSIPPTTSEISQNAELVLQAKCFYFTRKHELPPIDPSAYRAWLQSRPSDATAPYDGAGQTTHLSSATTSIEPIAITDASIGSGSATETDERPPYPTSFAAIVDLITRNVPVPGIEEIPDTVLDHGSSKVDHTPRRKKPWETDDDATEETSNETAHTSAAIQGDSPTEVQVEQDRVNGHLTTGEGVVKILQPNAIPDSGLLSKE